MTINEYQHECLKTMPKNLYRGEQALMSLMGMSSDTGSLLDIYSRILYDGQPLNEDEVMPMFDEVCLRLSHLARNLAICADAFDYDLETVLNRTLNEGKED